MSIFTEMDVFASVIQANSFTKAAERLNLSKSYVSKIISQLESKLGAKLIYRSTRKLSLTEVGAKFFNHCQQMQLQAETALNEVSLTQNSMQGILRVTAPHGIVTEVLPDIVNSLLSQYPDLVIEIDSTNELVDIVGQGIDLALRIGDLRSSELIAKRITTINNTLCATAQYCANNFTPTIPYDLTKLALASYASISKFKQTVEFEHNNDKLIVQVNPILKTNNSTMAKNFILDNRGLCLLPEYLISEELKSGRVIKLLSEYKLAKSPLYAVYPNRSFINYKTKTFIAALIKYFK